MIIPWNPWEAKPVSVERRNMWAEEIAAFTTTSIQSGDSIVWGEIDEGELELTDVLVRRTARIPIPEGCVNRERLREHAAALADALADIADDSRASALHGRIDAGRSAFRPPLRREAPLILTESDFTELHAVAQQVRICELESELRSIMESFGRAERTLRDVLHGAGASLPETLRASVAMTETRGLLAEALRHPDEPKANVLHFPRRDLLPPGGAA